MSEATVWMNGSTDGLDWHDMQISGGLACGTQDGTFNGTDFLDSVGILKGPWPSDQTVMGTIHITNQSATALSELELWLRGTITGHSISGYECVFSVRSSGFYIGVTRWNGPKNSFTEVDPGGLTGPGLHDGDVLMARAVGTTITTFVNGTLVCTADLTSAGGAVFMTGSPGIGHWRHDNGATGIANTDYGFVSMKATGP